MILQEKIEINELVFINKPLYDSIQNMQTSYKKSQKILAHIKKKVYLCPRNKFISRAEIQISIPTSFFNFPIFPFCDFVVSK